MAIGKNFSAAAVYAAGFTVSVAHADTRDNRSADEIAKDLANPNTPLASLNMKLQHRIYDGNLPGADDQDSTGVLFQPTLPFPADDGGVIFFRPAIPLNFNNPVFNTSRDRFESESGIGDTTFDLAYGRTSKTGFLWAAGIVSTLPTATNDKLGASSYTL